MTLTIDIPRELENRLEQEAARKGVAPDECVRMLLEERLATSDHTVPKPPLTDAWAVLESMMGTVDGPSDWSSEMDHYLYGTPKRSEQMR
jgi:hypothetical protein